MKTKSILFTLLLSCLLVAGMTSMCFADSFSFKGKCSFDGSKITSSFDSETFAAQREGLEPGDSLEYTITYTNNADFTTNWYMENRVLETLEDAKDAAENGGYTYFLGNKGPGGSGTETLFDNSKFVGGDRSAKDDDLGMPEGLKQATNATGKYFFIQKLEPGQTGTTKLKVTLDGETEVNDYMDTHGELMVRYAVEKTSTGGPPNNDKKKGRSVTQTGDPMSLIKYAAMMAAAIVLFILALVSWKRDKKKEGEEA